MPKFSRRNRKRKPSRPCQAGRQASCVLGRARTSRLSSPLQIPIADDPPDLCSLSQEHVQVTTPAGLLQPACGRHSLRARSAAGLHANGSRPTSVGHVQSVRATLLKSQAGGSGSAKLSRTKNNQTPERSHPSLSESHRRAPGLARPPQAAAAPRISRTVGAPTAAARRATARPPPQPQRPAAAEPRPAPPAWPHVRPQARPYRAAPCRAPPRRSPPLGPARGPRPPPAAAAAARRRAAAAAAGPAGRPAAAAPAHRRPPRRRPAAAP